MHSPDVEQHAYDLPYHWCTSRFQQELYRERVRRVADVIRGAIVLEVGCGDGFMTAEMASLATRVHAIDINKRAIKFAELIVQAPNVTLQTARAGDVIRVLQESKLGDLDVIAAFEVVEHLDSDELSSFLRASHAALQPFAGKLVISTPNAARRSEVGHFHTTEFTPTSLRSTLLDHGFRVTDLEGIYLNPPPNLRLEHFANTVPFRAVFRRLIRAGRTRPELAHTLVGVASPT